MAGEMFPPLFARVSADSGVRAIFGTSPVRVYPIGEAPPKGAPTYALPYATFQTVTGSPENNLKGRPDADGFGEQIDVMAATLTAARNGAKALRDAIEPVATVSAYLGERSDPDTKLAVYSFEVSWLTLR